MPDYLNEFILIGSHCWVPSIVSRPIRAREERADFYFKQRLEIADRGKDAEPSAHPTRSAACLHTQAARAQEIRRPYSARCPGQHNAQLPVGR